MKLYIQIIKALFCKYIKKQNTGSVIKQFCESMGTVYIKLAQMLATQNFGEIFTEEDRKELSSICDNCKPIEFSEIQKIIENEYKKPINEIFTQIDENPVGSASISQVHKAILKNGEIVAVKVKRKDVTKNIEEDINKIKKIVHKYGRFIKIKNLCGGDKALEFYLKWIYEETDFEHEANNIKSYSDFANSVNGKVGDTTLIKVPKIYNELCNENIIVMEFINSPTINKMKLDDKNKEIIANSINSYIKLSFYALFNNKKIVFHGDPHGGNIYIDSMGNIGFLDMGLIFELSKEDSDLIRKFFLTAYSRNYEKLYELLEPYINENKQTKEKFKQECEEYCKNISKRPVTCYFTDMINICLKYEIVPPNFLFCMSKSFICLNGINEFTKNLVSSTQLLQEQTIEYFIKSNIKDSRDLVKKGILLTPKLLKNTYKYGLIKGIAKETIEIEEIQSNLEKILENYKETLEILKIANAET